MPKSVSLAAPFAIMMLLGFTSRCTMPCVVGLDQRVGGLRQQRRRLGGVHGARGPHPLAQRLAVDVLHHQPAHVVLVDEVEDGHHVGVVERRGELRLALGALEVGAVRARDQPDALDRDLAAEDLVEREVHGAGATAADLPLEPVPACDHVPNLLRHSP